MSCGPCKDLECDDIAEDGDEYESLMKLYKRMFESTDKSGGGGRERPASAASGFATAAVDYCADGADESPMKRADRQLTAALLRQRAADGGQEGDVKHLTARLPAFKSCKNIRPGGVNASLFGLDLEHWMTASTTAGGGSVGGAKRAAYELAAAEAHCKHGGAVEAAEMAVNVEPAPNLAEVAARFGAQSYANTGNAADGAGSDGGDGSPVVVVAYVGSTGDDD